MNMAEKGKLHGIPTDYFSFSYFIGQIINWGVGALFFIWGLNIIMSMLRKIIMIIAGVKGE